MSKSDIYLEDFDVTKRGTEVKRAIDLFLIKMGDHKLIDEAVPKITGVYFQILKDYVKPLIPRKVNKFKMGSVLALTVIKLQPISKSELAIDAKQIRKVNAELAFFIAMNLILDMAQPNGYDMDVGIASLEAAMTDIKNQHLTWLQVKKLNSFPIFPVASFYFCFFTIFNHRFNAISN